MEEYYIGYVFGGLYPPEAAQWCNKNGTCHIEKNKDGKYEIFENVDQEEPEYIFNDDTPSISELNKKIEELTDRLLELSDTIMHKEVEA
uniref:Uncharacterized protein n=1 Tax=Myoviridae sp. ct0Qb19 TaxID=2827653 RepID=A0A8S5SZV0_9CAUD|nr:MAG TPA: hypothetical protein [Myoviridae sp. ct0Qb19]